MSIAFTAEEGYPIADGVVRVREFPTLGHAPQTVDLPAMDELVRGIRPEEIVLNEAYVEDSVDGALAELYEIPEHAKTRQANQNNLVFGMFVIASSLGEASVYGAVKPLGDQKVAREYAVSDHIHTGHLPLCDTFPPLGVMRFSDGQAALVTQYVHEVKSSDNVLWNPRAIGQTKVVNAVLGRAGVSLVTVHENQWILGDPQAKNMVARWIKPRRLHLIEADADPVFVNDLEDAEPIGHLTADEQRAKKLMDVDIFIWSAFRLQRRPVNPVELPIDFPEQLREAFGLTYVGAQNGSTRRGTALTMSEISELVEAESTNPSMTLPMLRQ